MSDSEDPKQEDKPLTTPDPVNPYFIWEQGISHAEGWGVRAKQVYKFITFPANWIRENVVLPNRGEKYYWYHKRFQRALPIDECYADDLACQYEADIEFKRNWQVDRESLNILRWRKSECVYWNKQAVGNVIDAIDRCKHLQEVYDREEMNYYIKYGDMRFTDNVAHFYNKQKHRMIMDRRKALKEQRGEGPEKTNVT